MVVVIVECEGAVVQAQVSVIVLMAVHEKTPRCDACVTLVAFP